MNGRFLRTLQIVVLAAGFSSRLGEPKALARVRGRSLLARTLDLTRGLAATSTLVVIPRNAARYKIEMQRVKVAWADNPRRAEGLSSSVRLGLGAARYASAVLFLPVDLVNLKRRELERLIRRWRSSPRHLVARALADSGAIPLILPKRLFARALAVSGDIGLRQLIAALPREQCVFVKLASAAADVDTPQALAAARRRRQSAL
jgi:molybdenum cofactor cytidylyltransferase